VVSYGEALDLQHRLVRARRDGRVGDVLILLEHPPVITLGRRGDESHILVSQEWLASQGIAVSRVERGGDVTYHGPGQIVGYPILDLRGHRQDVGWYMRSLEEVIVRTLRDFGIEAGLQDKIGVWVSANSDDLARANGEAKIAALGARIENWITYHGFALNVDPNLAHFQLIVPCGLTGKGVTSMRRVLDHPIDVDTVRHSLVQHFADVFDVQVIETTLAEIEERAR
jgi:lipoate-protein ligase B